MGLKHASRMFAQGTVQPVDEVHEEVEESEPEEVRLNATEGRMARLHTD